MVIKGKVIMLLQELPAVAVSLIYFRLIKY